MPGNRIGRCILIVEDEMCLAMTLEDALVDAGYGVHKAARIAPALRLLDVERLDAAFLDINLAGALVYPVADALRARGIPFIFTSSYRNTDLPVDYRATRLLEKPYSLNQLTGALDHLFPEPGPLVA